MTSPFWSQQAQYHASRLWIPPNVSLEPSNYGSWFSIHEYADPQPSALVLDGDPPTSPPVGSLKAIKIRLNPNVEQRQTLHKWFGTARWTYNRALDLVNENRNLRFNRTLLSQCCVNQDVFQYTENTWVLETPQSIRQNAAFDLVKAYNSTIDRYQAQIHDHGQVQPFQMNYRSRKDVSQSIVINHRSLKIQGKFCRIFPKYLIGKIKTTQLIPQIHHDCRLQWFPKLNQFYLCIPMDIEIQSEIQAPILNSITYQSIVSLDPGVRTFMTGYDSRGLVFKWGHQDISRIYRLCYQYDQLQSQWSQPEVRHRKRYRLKRVGARLQMKIRNLVDDLHKKFAKYLCKHFNLIIIPKFEIQGMIRRGQRRINSITARKMVTWAHYRFRQRLMAKAREYPNCRIMVVNEAYTSKTCGRCGRLNQNLGGNKVFRCRYCGLEGDRDVLGARNILIKMLSL